MATREDILVLGLTAGVTGCLVGGMMLGIGLGLVVQGAHLGWLLILPSGPGGGRAWLSVGEAAARRAVATQRPARFGAAVTRRGSSLQQEWPLRARQSRPSDGGGQVPPLACFPGAAALQARAAREGGAGGAVPAARAVRTPEGRPAQARPPRTAAAARGRGGRPGAGPGRSCRGAGGRPPAPRRPPGRSPWPPSAAKGASGGESAGFPPAAAAANWDVLPPCRAGWGPRARPRRPRPDQHTSAAGVFATWAMAAAATACPASGGGGSPAAAPLARNARHRRARSSARACRSCFASPHPSRARQARSRPLPPAGDGRQIMRAGSGHGLAPPAGGGQEFLPLSFEGQHRQAKHPRRRQARAKALWQGAKILADHDRPRPL